MTPYPAFARARTTPAVLLSAAFLWSMVAVSPALSLDKPVEVGQRVPEFALPDLEGRTVSFERDIRGKSPLTLLFFMTTACSPCFEELRELNDFVRRNPGKISIWSVAVDLRGAKTVGPYQKTNRFLVNYLIDPKFSLPRAFGFHYTPSLAIIDAEGVVLHLKGGYSPNENIPDLIRTFLK